VPSKFLSWWCLLWAGRVSGGDVDWLVSHWQKPLSLSAASIYAQFSLWLPLTTCFNTNGPGENSQSKWSLYNLEMKYGKYKASFSLKTSHYIYKCLNIWSYVIFQGEQKKYHSTCPKTALHPGNSNMAVVVFLCDCHPSPHRNSSQHDEFQAHQLIWDSWECLKKVSI